MAWFLWFLLIWGLFVWVFEVVFPGWRNVVMICVGLLCCLFLCLCFVCVCCFAVFYLLVWSGCCCGWVTTLWMGAFVCLGFVGFWVLVLATLWIWFWVWLWYLVVLVVSSSFINWFRGLIAFNWCLYVWFGLDFLVFDGFAGWFIMIDLVCFWWVL